jgi:hypothetical protein
MPLVALTGPVIEVIAAPVVPLGNLDQFVADARRSGVARQLTHLAGHLPVMIAVGTQWGRFTHCQ